MRAARIPAWGAPLQIVEAEKPQPRDAEVLVRIEACGIGKTVINYMQGDLGDDPEQLPRVPGHEYVGIIEDVGPGVDRDRIGQRVLAYFYLFCGTCDPCLDAREPLCEHLVGNIGVVRDGGYAEYATLPSRNALPVPEGVDPVAATTIPDAIATPVHVARRAALAPGQRVAVIAAGGGVGIHMVQVARVFGADVVGLDAATAKLDFLERELGVSVADSSDFAHVKLPASWNGVVDVVVDFLGSRDSLEWSLRNLGRAGRLVCLTTFRDVDAPFSPRQLVLSEISVVGSRYASRREVGLAAELVRSGHVKPVVSRKVRLEEVESLHDELRRGTLLGRGALVWD